MTVRGANYERKENDYYATPAEATRVVLDNVTFGRRVVDPAYGGGAIADVLRTYGYNVSGDDLVRGYDFLTQEWRWTGADIITNPPFGTGGRTAVQFVERALEVTAPYQGKIAMLLPVDFDSGLTRLHIFGACLQFTQKVILLNRIRWFNNQAGSINHAWFVWDHKHATELLPTIKYAKQIFS